MVTSVLKFFKENLGRTFLFLSLFASSFLNAQGPISGYAYLGSCTVNGQPHYYYASLNEATWPDAATAATNLGGYLATLTSQAENDCVFNNYVTYLNTSGLGQPTFANSYGDKRNPWIGLNDAVTENTFLWANGENCSNFRNWDCGFKADGTPTCEPNNVFTPGQSNGEDYVQLLAFTPAGGDPTPGYQGEYGKKHAGQWNDWFNTETQLYIVEFGPSSCVPVQRGNDGCTHGYWKNAKDNAWTLAGYDRNANFMTTFGVLPGNEHGGVTSSTTLQQSLELTGGGYAQVAKQGTAALLNAARGFYPYTAVEIITAVRQMFNSGSATLPTVTVNGVTYTGGSWTDPTSFASYLDMLNNLGCPLNNKGVLTSSTSREGLPSGGALANAFAVSGYPNPSRSSFTIQVSGLSSESVSIKVTDMTGRLIEQRTSVPANQTIQIGSTYRAGLYYIEVMQGAAKQQLKMVKQ